MPVRIKYRIEDAYPSREKLVTFKDGDLGADSLFQTAEFCANDFETNMGHAPGWPVVVCIRPETLMGEFADDSAVIKVVVGRRMVPEYFALKTGKEGSHGG